MYLFFVLLNDIGAGMKHYFQLIQVFLVLSTAIDETKATIEHNWYLKAKLGEMNTGTIGAKLTVKTNMHCSMMYVFLRKFVLQKSVITIDKLLHTY